VVSIHFNQTITDYVDTIFIFTAVIAKNSPQNTLLPLVN
jgi:hypothetical protein